MQEFGGSFHAAIIIWFLTNNIPDSRDTIPLAVEQLRPNDRSKTKSFGYLRTLFSNSRAFADSLVVLTWSVCIAAKWHISA